MYRTTQNFKNSIYAPVRRTAGRVTFAIIDVTASGDVTNITTSPESPLSLKSQLINRGRSMTYKAATMEKDRFKLDGSFSFADEVLANNEEAGWSSAVICDASGNFAQTVTENFVGKVSGSTVENANLAMHYNGSSLLAADSGSWWDWVLPNEYDPIKQLDGVKYLTTAATNGQTAMQKFSFNLIAMMKRKYGITVDVPWLKANVTKLTGNWHGFGSGPNGNKAYLYPWRVDNSSWWAGYSLNHGASTVTKLSRSMSGADMTLTIDANGFVHWLACADAATTIASTISTDYIELLVDIAPLTLSFDFGSNHSSAGLTITFDSVNGEYATDFDMTAYDAGGAVIATTSVTGNTDIIAVPIGQLYNYRKVSVTIKKWSKPNRRARVFEVDFGFVKQYTDDNLVNLSLVEEMDLLTGKLPSAEFKFTIDNSDRLFNILNPTGFYKYLQQRQQVIGEIGLDVGGGNFEYIPLGNYLLQEWQSDEGSLTATFTARTNLDSMASFDFQNLTAFNQSLYDLALSLFVYCGITNYSLDPALKTITTNSLVEKTNFRDLLQMIAIAGGANIYVTRDGKITLKCNKTRKVRYIRDWISGGSNANQANHWIEVQATNTAGTNVALGKAVTTNIVIANGSVGLVTNGDTSAAAGTYLGADTSLLNNWVQVDLGSVMDIETVKVWHYYADGRIYNGTKTEISTDGVTWKTVFDSSISGTYAETAAGRTYAMETVLGDMTPVDSADFDNMYNEPQIALDKAIKRVEATYWTDLSTSGVVGVNHPVNTVGDTLKLEKNTLINTSARAQAVADWLMAQLAYRATYSVRWRGNPALELNDVLSMENTYGSTMNAYVTKNEIEYAGYLTVKTQAKGGVN